MMKVKNYVCPECGKIFKTLGGWSSHMEEKHPDMIPEGFTLARFFYYLQTGKDHGTCIICKRESDWNEESMKYNRFCNDPACKKEYRKRFEKNCINKNGYVHKLDDPEVQRKMLAARKISGKYRFTNSKGVKEYVGKDELAFLETLDLMGWPADDIMSPSPHTYEYDYKNPKDKEHEGKHFYIPDFYIPSINCEIECKDTSNNHHKIRDIDNVKDRCKRAAMEANTMVNYAFIAQKDMTPFYDLLFEMKRTFLNKEIVDKKPGNTMRIIDKAANESVVTLATEGFTIDTDAINTLRASMYRKAPEISYANEAISTSSFKKIPLNSSNIGKYKAKYRNLSHIRTGEDYKGFIWVDSGDNPVGFISVRQSDHMLQGLEIVPAHRGKGLSKVLLDAAVSELGARNLTVRKNNTRAIDIYDKNGWKIKPYDFNGTDSMYYMTLESATEDPANESLIFSSKDKKYNVEKWGTSPENNILWITGHSGSGKSTLGKELQAKDPENVRLIELDNFFRVGEGEEFYKEWEMSLGIRYNYMWPLIKDKVAAMMQEYKRSTSLDLRKHRNLAVDDLIADIVLIARSDTRHRYIFEGIQIFGYIPYELIEGQPIIIKGTSAIKSAHRAAKRSATNRFLLNDKSPTNRLNAALAYAERMTDKRNIGSYKEGDELLSEFTDKVANETMIFSSKDRKYNVEKWGKSPGMNILWVTGFSGSGKSSIGEELSKKNTDVRVIALDDIFGNPVGGNPWEDLICEWYPYMWKNIKSEVLEVAEIERREITTGMSEDKKWSSAMNGLLNKIVDYCQKDYGRHRYVIEGLQIYEDLPYELIQNQPLIIKGTSALKSNHRAIKRDFADLTHGSLKDKFTGARKYIHYMTEKDRIDWYREADKQMKELGNKFEATESVTEDAALESIVFSTKDKKFNLEKWGKSPETNILWVTGFSGSGKSTIAVQLAESNEDVVSVSLDHFFGKAMAGREMRDVLPEAYDFMWDRIKSEYKRVDSIGWDKNRDRHKWGQAMDALIAKIIKCAHDDFGKYRYVIEGIQVYDFIQYETIKGQPLIIKGTSALKSMYRASKRDSNDTPRETLRSKLEGITFTAKMTLDGLKGERIERYKGSNKQLEDLAKRAEKDK